MFFHLMVNSVGHENMAYKRGQPGLNCAAVVAQSARSSKILRGFWGEFSRYSSFLTQSRSRLLRCEWLVCVQTEPRPVHWRSFTELALLSRRKAKLWPSLSSLDQVFNSLLHSAVPQPWPASLCQHGDTHRDAVPPRCTVALLLDRWCTFSLGFMRQEDLG